MPKDFIPSTQTSSPSKRTIWGLNALLFFISDVRHGVGPLLSIYLHSDLRWNPTRIGFALGAIDLSAVICQLPAGMIVDASRSKRILIAFACLCIIGGCFFIVGRAEFATLIFAQMLMGLAIAFIGPSLGAITMGIFGKKRYPWRTSRNEMWNHAGNVFTALMIGLVSYLYGHHWIFYIVILFALASLLSLAFIQPQEIDYHRARESPKDPKTGESLPPLSLRQLFKRKAIFIFNGAIILYYIANAAQIAMVGQILATKHPQEDALFLAGCMLIAEFVMIGTAFGMGFIVNRLGRKPIFLTAFCILPIRAILFTFTDNPYLLLSIQILDGMAAGIIGVIGSVINSDLAIGSGRFNFLQGMSALSTSIGASFSNVLAGLIATGFGFHTSFFMLAAIALVGITFYALCMPETKINYS
jgi:MFS family permease